MWGRGVGAGVDCVARGRPFPVRPSGTVRHCAARGGKGLEVRAKLLQCHAGNSVLLEGVPLGYGAGEE